MDATIDHRHSDEGVADLLLAEHAHLERRFREIANAIQTAERPLAQREWDDFERGLTAHMDWEERELLPAFAHAAPADAEAIRAEHARFRGMLTDLGVQLDLRALRAERVDEFIALLRAHAEREDRGLYRHADETLPSSTRARLRAHLLAGRDDASRGPRALPRDPG